MHMHTLTHSHTHTHTHTHSWVGWGLTLLFNAKLCWPCLPESSWWISYLILAVEIWVLRSLPSGAAMPTSSSAVDQLWFDPWSICCQATRGVAVSTSAFLACHQCYCVGLSLAWGLNLRAFVCGLFWSSRHGFSPGTPGSSPPSSVNSSASKIKFK